jgi:hypothetical protein
MVNFEIAAERVAGIRGILSEAQMFAKKQIRSVPLNVFCVPINIASCDTILLLPGRLNYHETILSMIVSS